MKGVEEFLQQFIFITASIIAILLLMTIATDLLQPESSNELEINGNKEYVMQELRNLIYKCWEDNKGELETSICFKVFLNYNGFIKGNEIVNKIDTRIIEKEKVEVEDIYGPTNLVIKYEKDKVTIEGRSSS